MTTIRATDLFCGAGGTSTGLLGAARRLGVDVRLLAIIEETIMPNMSYCRIQNTVEDLAECVDYLDEYRSAEEEKAFIRLVELCRDIVNYADSNGY